MSWAHSIGITIDHTRIDAALTDFPLQVNLAAACGLSGFDATDVFTELGSNSKKIKIEDAGNNQLYVEIERWDAAAESAQLWVKVPSISASADTILTLYYDSTQPDNTTYVGAIGAAPAQNVWDSDFAGVYHLSQDPAGGSGSIKDSTSNGYNGTPHGSMTSGDIVDGVTGQALDFDGADDRITVSGWDPNGAAQVTGELVFSVDTFDGVKQALFMSYSGSNASFLMDIDTDDKLRGNAVVNGVGQVVKSAVLNSAQWYYGSYKWSSPNAPGLNLDGTQLLGSAVSGTLNKPGGNWSIGNWDGVGRYFDGKIQEVRFSKIERSDAWIAATYHTTFDNLTTLSGAQTTVLVDARLDLTAAGWERDDLASDLSALARALEDLAAHFIAHGYGRQDFELFLSARVGGLEDLATLLSAWRQARGDLPVFLKTMGYGRADLATPLQAADLFFNDLPAFLKTLAADRRDLPMPLAAAGTRRLDLAAFLSAGDGTVLSDLGAWFAATDGTQTQSLSLALSAMRLSPLFVATVAQRLSANITEVT